MRRVARRLDDKTAEVEIVRQASAGDDPAEDRGDAVVKLGKKVHSDNLASIQVKPRVPTHACFAALSASAPGIEPFKVAWPRTMRIRRVKTAG